MNALSIIIVDDEKPILKALRRELSPLSAELSLKIKTFLRPGDALNYIRNHSENVAVLISDQKMPEMKGCDLIAKVRGINTHIVSILLTAYTDTEDIIKSIRSGIFSFIQKPWDKPDLEHEVRKAFLHHRKASESFKKSCLLEEEMEGGRQLQEKILAPRFNDDPRFNFSVCYKPHLSCGGDYYDFLKIDEDHYIVAIGDVAGHGIKAAFITFALKTVFKDRAFIKMAKKKYSLDVLMAFINKRIFRILKDIQPLFISLCLCKIDLNEKKMFLCNGGHMPPLIMRDNKIIETDGAGTALGFDDDLRYQESCIPLKGRDRIILYTDGLTEAAGGIDRFKEILLFYTDNPFFTSVVTENAQKAQAGESGKDDKTIISLELDL